VTTKRDDGGSQTDADRLAEATGLDAPPPPPSPELARAVGGMRPVRTRSRFGAAAAVALAGIVWPAIALVHLPHRRDLGALPVAWVIAAAALWAAAFTVSLTAALVPRRGDVLPAAGRASRVAAAAMLIVAAFALFATVDAPGVSMRPQDRGWSPLHACLHCIGFVFEVAAVFLVAGVFALRRLVPVGGARVGLALGAAAGAMGGLVLHFICPFASTTHVVLGHVGGMVLAAAAGALLAAAVIRR
jgi:hypothetical protein